MYDGPWTRLLKSFFYRPRTNTLESRLQILETTRFMIDSRYILLALEKTYQYRKFICRNVFRDTLEDNVDKIRAQKKSKVGKCKHQSV